MSDWRDLPPSFWHEVDEESVVKIHVATRIGAVVLLFFFLLYLSVFPADLQLYVSAMQGTILLVITAVSLAPIPPTPRIVRSMLVLVVLIFTIQVNGTLAFTSGPTDIYYYAQVLANLYLICGIGIFVPWPMEWVFLLCLIPLTAEIAVCSQWPLELQVRPLGISVFAVLGSVLASRIGFRIRVEETRNREEAIRLATGQRDLVAMLSHDLANPLGSIVTTARFVSADPEVDSRKMAGPLGWATARALDLIRNFIDVSSLDVDRPTLRLEGVRLDRLVPGLVEQEQFRAHRQEIDLRLEADTDVRIVADVEKVGRIIANLLSNALRHTPKRGTVTVSVRQVEGFGAEIAVSDTGPGIPPELRERLFERFVRGGGQRKDSTGLGLYIVRSFAEAHGGSVTVEDGPGGVGSVFRVLMPSAPPSRKESATAATH